MKPNPRSVRVLIVPVIIWIVFVFASSSKLDSVSRISYTRSAEIASPMDEKGRRILGGLFRYLLRAARLALLAARRFAVLRDREVLFLISCDARFAIEIGC